MKGGEGRDKGKKRREFEEGGPGGNNLGRHETSLTEIGEQAIEDRKEKGNRRGGWGVEQSLATSRHGTMFKNGESRRKKGRKRGGGAKTGRGECRWATHLINQTPSVHRKTTA